MATSRIDLLDQAFDDHPSLSASLEDYEHAENRSPMFAIPSQHSGFRSDESEPDAESNSEGPWCPPAWRKPNIATNWYQHQPYAQSNQGLKPSVTPSRSRGISPQYESARDDDGDLTIPANIPLPRGSLSPVKERSPSPSPYPSERPQEGQGPSPAFEKVEHHAVPPAPENANNCMRMNGSPKKNQIKSLTAVKIFALLFAPRFSTVQNLLTPRSRGFADILIMHPNRGRPSPHPSCVSSLPTSSSAS